MNGWIEQWNLYVPGLLGAVKLAVPLALTGASKLLPSSAVTVWAVLSSFFTETFWPGLTVNGLPKAKLEIVICAAAAPAGADEPAAGADADVLAAAGGFDAFPPEELPPHAAAANRPAAATAATRNNEAVMGRDTSRPTARFTGQPP